MLKQPISLPRSQRDVSLMSGALDVLFEIMFAVVNDLGALPGKWRTPAPVTDAAKKLAATEARPLQ